MADEEEQQPEPKKPGKLRWVIFAVVGLVVLVGGGFATVRYVLPPPPTGDQAAGDPTPKPPAELRPFQFKLPEIIVNIDEGRLERMLKVLIVLEIPVENEEQSLRLSETLTKHQSEIKDRLITLFAGKSLSELGGGADSKSAIKAEVTKALDDLLFKDSERSIRRVLFDMFLIQ